ncbi:HAD family hydrolase [Gordonia soli]|uniref:Putative hydrolase n=1 Tax=Gordonia soli NBRC 108243 TaxID=1223545 RepID=M0QIF5_9ACTN|nr:HAD family hydrolase [Gordonia soli]GAC68375.1 putative hydrolase [Gordonia soli NBRC 108243]
MAISAVLFDIDGTLVDSVYAHVGSWQRAFAEVGRTVPAAEIHRQIGKDGSLLVHDLMTDHGGFDQQVADDASERHSRLYLADASRLDVLPSARELLSAVAGRGLRVVLATSAPPEELEILRDLLDVEEHVYAVTSGDDVDTAKPDATVVAIAVERAGVDPAEAVMVGDATWDAIAATKIGVRSVGVRAGGIGADELADAGAAVVYDDPADLLAHLDEALDV